MSLEGNRSEVVKITRILVPHDILRVCLDCVSTSNYDYKQKYLGDTSTNVPAFCGNV